MIVKEQVGDLLEQDATRLEAITLRLGWVMRRRLEQQLDAFHLTLPQYMALNCVQRSESGCSMSELAESSHQLSATMTGIIDRLVDRGLVVRERDPHDRRALRVMLTEEGRALIQEVSASKRAWTRQMLAELPEDERRRMIDVASRYLKIIEDALEM